MSTLRDWLADNDLSACAEILEANDVGVDVVPLLTDGDLRELGFSLGQRKRFLNAASALRTEADDRPSSFSMTGGQRRRLTVMFCDLVGSTSLSERLDPEDLRGVLAAYQEACRAVIARYQGHIAQYLGDGIVAYFGWPNAHEDDARRSVFAGLGIVAAVKQLQLEVALQVRIGIVTGPVVIAGSGDGDASKPGGAIGSTPNLAARIQSLAGPDEVLVGEATHRLLGNSFTSESCGSHQLKGFREPVEVWRIVGGADVGNRFELLRNPASSGQMLGRDAEIESLVREWEMSRTGRAARIVAITGPAGIGKSRLIHELKEIAAARGGAVLSVDCAPNNEYSSLYPAGEFVARAALICNDDNSIVRLAKLTALARLVRHDLEMPTYLLASLLNVPGASGDYAYSMTPALQRQELFKLLEDLFLHHFSEQSTVLVIEDAHWSDPSTLELLARIVQRAAQRALFVVVSARAPITIDFAASVPAARMDLEKLDYLGCERLISRVAGDKKLPGTVVDDIVKKADGIPLFVEEITRSILASKLLAEVADRYVLREALPVHSVPDSLHDSLAERLDKLGPLAQFCGICAAIGRDFGVDMLQDLVDIDASEVRDALDQLSAAGIVYRKSWQPAELYSFRHALIQEAAYGSMLREVRQDLHERIAKNIEKSQPHLIALRPELLGHHYLEAGNKIRALNLFKDAALNALMRSAYVEATGHCRRALSMLDAIADLNQRKRTEIDINSLMAPAMMVHYGYTSRDLQELCSRTVTLVNELGDEPSLFQALWTLQHVHHLRSERAQAKDYALRLVKLARDSNDDSLLAVALPLLGQCIWIEGDYHGARVVCEEGMKAYDSGRDRSHGMRFGIDSLVYILMLMSQLCWAAGEADAARAHIDRAVDYGHEIGHANSIGLAMLFRATLFHEFGDRATTEAAARETMQYCERFGVATPMSYVSMVLMWSTGDLDGMKKTLDLHKLIGATLGFTFYASQAIDCALNIGRFDDARQLLDACFAFAEEKREVYWLARLHLLRARLMLSIGGGGVTGVAGIPTADQVTATLEKAIQVATEQGAKVHQVDAAIELARHLGTVGDLTECDRVRRAVVDAAQPSAWLLGRAAEALS
ncbi:MAG: hypothetical protein RIQ60_1943 [Pseudomonadota bacterium]|jgi:class 3 adenylate cyclase/tetratricopeptide (TPR) repeat protein/energy-coupling factor transporter ATP-binding protein EcfA2